MVKGRPTFLLCIKKEERVSPQAFSETIVCEAETAGAHDLNSRFFFSYITYKLRQSAPFLYELTQF